MNWLVLTVGLVLSLATCRGFADEFGFPKPLPNQMVFDVVALVDSRKPGAESEDKDLVFVKRTPSLKQAIQEAPLLKIGPDGRHRVLIILCRQYGKNGEVLVERLEFLPATRVRRAR